MEMEELPIQVQQKLHNLKRLPSGPQRMLQLITTRHTYSGELTTAHLQQEPETIKPITNSIASQVLLFQKLVHLLLEELVMVLDISTLDFRGHFKKLDIGNQKEKLQQKKQS